MADSNILDDSLFYDTHAKNVIVDCKDGKDLESLIRDGEIGGNGNIPDMGNAIRILYLSTIPDLENIANAAYNYTPVGVIHLSIGGTVFPFYAYIRNAVLNDSIPIGTVILNEVLDETVVASLGGTWEYIGTMVFNISGVDMSFYAYKKSGNEEG